jgi:hypothetical protein
MTPEMLEALEGIDDEAVNGIQTSINGYYGQDYAAESEADVAAAEPAGAPEAEAAAAPDAAAAENIPAPEPDSVENTTELASGTIVEPVESIEGAEGEQAADAVSAPPDEPQAGR